MGDQGASQIVLTLQNEFSRKLFPIPFSPNKHHRQVSPFQGLHLPWRTSVPVGATFLIPSLQGPGGLQLVLRDNTFMVGLGAGFVVRLQFSVLLQLRL